MANSQEDRSCAQFVERLYSIVSTQETNNLIFWQNENSFVIPKVKEFFETGVPKKFFGPKMSRKNFLNYTKDYGFILTCSIDSWSYSHKDYFFVKSTREKLYLIKSKKVMDRKNQGQQAVSKPEVNSSSEDEEIPATSNNEVQVEEALSSRSERAIRREIRQDNPTIHRRHRKTELAESILAKISEDSQENERIAQKRLNQKTPAQPIKPQSSTVPKKPDQAGGSGHASRQLFPASSSSLALTSTQILRKPSYTIVNMDDSIPENSG